MNNPVDFKCVLCGAGEYKRIGDYKNISSSFRNLEIVECSCCRHRSAFPAISNLHFAEYYQNDYFDADYETKKHGLLVKRAVYKTGFIASCADFKHQRYLRVLDIGAGFGHIGKELKTRFKSLKVSYDTVESNEKAIQYMSLPESGADNVFRKLDEIGELKYDLIILSHILEHLSDPVETLMLLTGKLNKNGLLFVEVPNEYSLWKNEQEPHIQFFSPDTLKKILIRSGFCLAKMDTCGDLIEDCILNNEYKSLDIAAGKILKTKRLSEMNCYGGNRRWIRSLCGKQKNILFLLLYPVYVRNFEPIIRELASRGYKIHLVFNDLEKYRKEGVKEVIDERLREIAKEYPQVTFDVLNPAPKREFLKDLACDSRAFCDYIRYLDPRFSFMHSLRQRCRKKFFSGFMVFADNWYRIFKNIPVLFFIYRIIEKFLGVPGNIKEFLRNGKYDAVFVTPLVNIGSEQLDYIKAAKNLKIPSVLTVHSWDNLTNKGLMRILPDRVCVWNNFQVKEAMTLNGMEKDNVFVTGAQCYDHWFERKPRISLEEFCTLAGLQKKEGFLLYLGSSKAIAPFEVPFVQEWIKRIRHCQDEYTVNIPIIIRPHPQNAKQWENVQFEEKNVAIYPRSGKQTIGEDAKQEYFHSLYYAEAVIGINTSAMIEASILRKPVLTILDDKFKGSQEETYHFRYLKDIGPVYSSVTLDDHVKQLSRLLKDPSEAKNRDERFIGEFIRPHGMDKKATDIFADKIGTFLLKR